MDNYISSYENYWNIILKDGSSLLYNAEQYLAQILDNEGSDYQVGSTKPGFIVEIWERDTEGPVIATLYNVRTVTMYYKEVY
jgi:hypothetical protein